MRRWDAARLALRDAADMARLADSKLAFARSLLPVLRRSPEVLNERPAGESGAEASGAVASMRQLMQVLKSDAVTTAGVDYTSLKGHSAFAQLQLESSRLQHFDPLRLSPAEAKAFWINLYNVLCIHGVVHTGVRQSVMERPGFFQSIAYRVGAFVLTPDDIEHGVLRGNGAHPGTGARAFAPNDGRHALSMPTVDPRIHAALVCTARSCPPIALYEADAIEAQLDLAAANYVATEVQVDEGRKQIALPIVFHYFASDFGGPDGVLAFLQRYAEQAQRDALTRVPRRAWSLRFRRYDWSLKAV